MEKIWIITIAVAIFLIINFLFYKTPNVYYKNEFGKKMWKQGGARVYFWQASIFVSTAGTALIMYLLKWSNVLTFQKSKKKNNSQKKKSESVESTQTEKIDSVLKYCADVAKEFKALTKNGLKNGKSEKAVEYENENIKK